MSNQLPSSQIKGCLFFDVVDLVDGTTDGCMDLGTATRYMNVDIMEVVGMLYIYKLKNTTEFPFAVLWHR